MKKFKWILPLLAIVAVVGVLTFVAIDGGTAGQQVTCGGCNGVGKVLETCDTCGNAQAIQLQVGEEEYEAVYTPETQSETACEDCGGSSSITTCEDCEGKGYTEPSNYYATWMALLAPVIAIALALITKEVYSSLMIGVVVGGLLAYNFNVVNAVDGVIRNGVIAAVSDAYIAGILVFLVILGAMVALINKTGGAAAFGRWAKKNIKTRVGAQLATFVLGVLIFIDDYFNCLTVGGVMRPVTDSKNISRAKLAYIIDATAAPICMIAPISSWAAAVAANAKDYSEDISGIQLFIQAIPYNLYSLLTLVFVVALIVMKFDFGPMKRHELNAMKGDLMSGGQATELEEEEYNHNGRTIDLILPVLVLVAVCVVALLYVGGFFAGADFITAFGDTDASVALPLGAFAALVFTIAYLIARRIINFKEAMATVPKGFVAMVPAILILTLATALKNMTGMLGADVFVGGLMEGSAASLANFLPAIIFLVAIFLSFSTGTSWGTFGILIPIVLNIPYDVPELKIIAVSACLAGSVCGDHCSPISDTTIMSSAGAQCDHVNHVSTQMPYALTVAAISFVGYVLAGFVQNVFVVLGTSIILMLVVLFVLKLLDKKST